MKRFAWSSFMVLQLMATVSVAGQAPVAKSHQVAGASLHYLDFGGDGLPIVFIHAADRSAETWIDFAPHFTDANRVLALTARGVGESSGEPSPAEVRAADLVSLLDSLGLAQAVFVGNSSPAEDMTFLAEHFPDRVAGLVYLANAPFLSGIAAADPTGAFQYALTATQPPQSFQYRPGYLDEPSEIIEVPSLTFVSESGTRGMEKRPFPLMVARMASADGTDWITDSEAREFLARLASDAELQAEVALAWEEYVVPAILGNERAFKDAFGPNLRTVRLPIPLVSGYEYRDRPDLITPHLESFLAELAR